MDLQSGERRACSWGHGGSEVAQGKAMACPIRRNPHRVRAGADHGSSIRRKGMPLGGGATVDRLSSRWSSKEEGPRQVAGTRHGAVVGGGGAIQPGHPQGACAGRGSVKSAPQCCLRAIYISLMTAPAWPPETTRRRGHERGRMMAMQWSRPMVLPQRGRARMGQSCARKTQTGSQRHVRGNRGEPATDGRRSGQQPDRHPAGAVHGALS